MTDGTLIHNVDDDDFDPEAGFQKGDPQNQWEGEDEGLDIDVSG